MAKYRVRYVPNQHTLEKHFIATDGRERPLRSGAMSHADEARSEAALAILGDHMRGDFPRAWRLVDAFEREFLSGDFTERTIDAGAVDQWVRRRERSRG